MAVGSPAWTARWTSSRRRTFSAFKAATPCCHRARTARFASMFAVSGRPGRCSTYPSAPARPTVPATTRRDPLGRSLPTTEGSAATVVASSTPPSSARSAGRNPGAGRRTDHHRARLHAHVVEHTGHLGWEHQAVRPIARVELHEAPEHGDRRVAPAPEQVGRAEIHEALGALVRGRGGTGSAGEVAPQQRRRLIEVEVLVGADALGERTA